MSSVEVHFDYVLIDDDVEVGALLLDDGEVIDSALKTYEGIRYHKRSNNYQFSILSWRLAVDLVIQYCMEEGFDYDEVVFCNQNELMFKWFMSRKPPQDYYNNMKILSERLAVMKDFDVDNMSVRLIKGSDNRAKKTLKKRKNLKTGSVSRSVDLNNLEMELTPKEDSSESKHKKHSKYRKKGNDIRPYGGDVNLRDKVESSTMNDNVISMSNWDRKNA